MFDALAERALPLVNDFFLGPAKELRRELLSEAKGVTLEIGFGSGSNAELYTKNVSRVIALEPSEPMWSRGQKRAEKCGLPVERLDGFAENISLDDESVDTVVSTFVLCSVHSPKEVLDEIRRVLRPGGKLLLIEHIEHPNARIARLQQLVTPAWRKCLAGCHPGRPLDKAVTAAGFQPVWSERRNLSWLPFLVEHHLVGVWARPSG
jgi:ubiquinone/menaquinone biosynthesis C-methylase UbiE